MSVAPTAASKDLVVARVGQIDRCTLQLGGVAVIPLGSVPTLGTVFVCGWLDARVGLSGKMHASFRREAADPSSPGARLRARSVFICRDDVVADNCEIVADNPEYVYIRFPLTGEILEADSIEAAKALLRRRFPNSHCGQWQQAPHGVNLPFWPGAAAQLRYELGETEDKHKPLAYVVVSNLRLRVPRVAKT